MENETLIQVLAMVISLISLASNVLLTVSETKKKHMLENYTKERLTELHRIKDIACSILLETDPSFISINNSLNIKEIIKLCDELSFYLKPAYEIDRKTIVSINNLKKAALEYSKGHGCDINSLKESGLQFRQNIYRYIHSSWMCIKLQVQKGIFTTYKEFEEIYNSTEVTIFNIKEGSIDVWDSF